MKRVLSLLLSLLIAFPVSLWPTSVQSAGQEAGNADNDSNNSEGPGAAKTEKDSQSKDFQVNLAMGSAGFGIPIQVLPGKDGIQPALGLSYSSDSGRSWVGWGFVLGSGEIVRKGKSGVAKFNPSNSPDADTFSLAMSGISSDLTLKTGSTNEFLTDEEKFLKITKDESGNGWTVLTPDGTKYEFGFTRSYLGFRGANEPHSQINAKENATTSKGSGFQFTRAWALSKVTSPNGYWMEFEYTTGAASDGDLDDTNGGDYHLKEIRYTYGPNGLDTGRAVKFNLEFRCAGMVDNAGQSITASNCNNVMASYETGSYVLMDRRLDTIEIFADRAQTKVYRQYTLYYTNATVQGDPLDGQAQCNAGNTNCNTDWITPESKLTRVEEFAKDASQTLQISNRWVMTFTGRPMGWQPDNGQTLPFQFVERYQTRFANRGAQFARVKMSARPDLVSAFDETYGQWTQGTRPGNTSSLESRKNEPDTVAGRVKFITPSYVPPHSSGKKEVWQTTRPVKYKWNSTEYNYWNNLRTAGTAELPATMWCACRESPMNQNIAYFTSGGAPVTGVGSCWDRCVNGDPFNQNVLKHSVEECQQDKDSCGAGGIGKPAEMREYWDEGAFMIDINGDALVDRVVLQKGNQRYHPISLPGGDYADGVLTCGTPMPEEQTVYLNSGSGWVAPDGNAPEGSIAKEGWKYTEGLKAIGRNSPWGPWAYTVEAIHCDEPDDDFGPDQLFGPTGVRFANLNNDKCLDLMIFRNFYNGEDSPRHYYGTHYDPIYTANGQFLNPYPYTPPRAIAVAKCDGSGEYVEMEGGNYTALIDDPSISTNLGSIPRAFSAGNQLFDVNGDGMDDFVVALSGYTTCTDDDPNNQYPADCSFIDTWGNSNPRGEYKVFLNNGHGWAEDAALSRALRDSGIAFGQETQGSITLQYDPRSYASMDLQVADLNNDHKPDFVSNCWVKINNGNLGFPDAALKKTPSPGLTCRGGLYTGATTDREVATPIDMTVFMEASTLGPFGAEYRHFNGSYNYGTQLVSGFDGTTNVAFVNSNGEKWPSATTCATAQFGSCKSGDLDPNSKVYLANTENGQPAGLLRSVQFPSGQSLMFDYTSSADTSPEMPFIKNVVRQMTTSDGRGNSYISQYQYQGGIYDTTKGEFRGFRKVTAIDPQGNKSITYYHQSTELRGMADKIQVLNSAGQLYSEDRFYYTDDFSTPDCSRNNLDCSVPRFNPIKRHDHFTVNGEGSVDTNGDSTMTNFLQSRSETSYICDTGDCKSGGLIVLKVDKNFGSPTYTPLLKRTSTSTRFVPNTTSWILQLPAQVKLYAGRTGQTVTNTFDSATNWVSYQEMIYDGATDSLTPAASRRLVKSISRGNLNGYVNDGVNGYAITKYVTYDSTYKHSVTQTDELGRVTHLEYLADTTSSNVGEEAVDHVANIYPTRAWQSVNGIVHETRTNYDLFGRATSVTKNGPGDLVQTTEYDLFDRPIRRLSKAQDSIGLTTYSTVTTTYSGFCDDPGVCGANQIPDPSDSSTQPPKIHTEEKQDDARTVWTDSYVDKMGRIYLTVSEGESELGGDRCSKTIYNDAGSIKQVQQSIPYVCTGTYSSRLAAAPTAPNLWSNTTSDLLGRPVQVQAPSSSGSPIVAVTQYSAGITHATDARGNRKDYYYNDLGQLSSIHEQIDSQEHILNYVYDVLGNLSSVTDMNDGSHYITTSITYDGFGRKCATQDPDMGTWTYYYDAAGNLTNQTDAKGNHLDIWYDELNRVTKRRHSFAGHLTHTYEDLFAYDTIPRSSGQGGVSVPSGLKKYAIWPIYAGASLGQMVRSTSTQNGIEYFRSDLTYDAVGRLNSKRVTISGQAIGFAYSYNVANQPTTLTLDTLSASPETVSYTYNTAGLLQKITTTSPATTIINDVRYDAAGRSTLIAQGKEADPSTNNLLESTLTYNVNGNQLLNQLQSKKRSSGTILQTFGYGYDENGNITSMTGTNGSFSYVYDAFDRLLTADGPASDDRTYSYDLNGGLLFVTGSYTPFGKSYGKQTPNVSQPILFTYANNAIFPAHAPKADTRYAYQYDANGNLVQLHGSTGSQWFEYNALNKVSKYTNEQGIVAQYLYDAAGTRIAKLNSTGNVLERYFGPIDVRDGNQTKAYVFEGRRVAERSTAGLTFYLQDHLGSNSIQTDANGTKIYSVSNYEFGAEKTTSGPSPLIKYGYTGKRLDAESEQNDYSARSYASRNMHFTTADSVVPNVMDPQSFNRFAYVKNNPMKYVDPTGHSGVSFLALPPVIDNDFMDEHFGQTSQQPLPTPESRVETGTVPNPTFAEVYSRVTSDLGKRSIVEKAELKAQLITEARQMIARDLSVSQPAVQASFSASLKNPLVGWMRKENESSVGGSGFGPSSLASFSQGLFSITPDGDVKLGIRDRELTQVSINVVGNQASVGSKISGTMGVQGKFVGGQGFRTVSSASLKLGWFGLSNKRYASGETYLGLSGTLGMDTKFGTLGLQLEVSPTALIQKAMVMNYQDQLP